MLVLKIVISVICGWLVGVIINYLSDTLPLYRKLNHPSCANCHEKYEYLHYLMGKNCNICEYNRSYRFWLVIISMILTVGYVLIIRDGTTVLTIFEILVFSYLTLITVIDLEHHLVLNITILTGVIVLGVIGIISHGWKISILGGLAGFVIMLLLYLVGQVYGRAISKKRGIEVDDVLGFGDVSLSSVCGLLLGFPGVVTCIVLAIALGGLWSIGTIIIARIRKSPNPLMRYIAYAPFITLAAATLWFMQI